MPEATAAPAPQQAPAVHIQPVTAETERDALGKIYDVLLAVRWNSQVHPSLNPYHATMILLKGQRTFEAEYIADLELIARTDPWIAGRVDGRGMARRCRRELVHMVARWSERRLGRARPLREIAAIFEELWRPPAPPVKLRDAVFELEEFGDGAGHVDAFYGSALKRKGTLHELCEDIADPKHRAAEHALIERELVADETGTEPEDP